MKMEYEKKTAVLKQIESGFSQSGKQVGGIIRIESQSGISEVYLSLINFSMSDGNYFAFILDSKKKLHKFDLGRRPTSLIAQFSFPPDLNDGFCAAVTLVKNDLPLTVAFARSEQNKTSVQDLKKTIAAFLLNERRSQKPLEQPIKSIEQPKDCQTVKYDDEAVATENYFDFEKEHDFSKPPVTEIDHGTLQPENERIDCASKEEERKAPAHDQRDQNETSSVERTQYSEQNPYYESVRNELNTLFLNFPENASLKDAFSECKFVKVFHSENNFYTVGVIKENGKEKYICYGVPGTYSPKPPEQLKGFCSFIPLSVFDLNGDGYWMIFQDAVTGECIKPS